MKDTEFTPGDWFYKSPEIIAPAKGSVCLLNVRPTVEEAEANAHLIAAAPDMFQALQECVRRIEAVHGRLMLSDSNTLNPALDRARAALSKAKGQHTTEMD